MPQFRRRNTRRARDLRNNATPAEKLLWQHLKGRKLDGYKFNRQLELTGPAYGDFICRSHRLIIELDGESHDFTAEEDALRTQRLEQLGYLVIRFTNEDVFKHCDGVLAVIAEALRNRPTPALRACPSRKREGQARALNSPCPQTGGAVKYVEPFMRPSACGRGSAAGAG